MNVLISEARSDWFSDHAILAAEHDLSPDGILVVDVAEHILSFNRRFAEMWGIPAAVLQSAPGQRVPDAPVLDSVLAKLEDPHGFLERVKHLYSHRDERAIDVIRLLDGRVFERHSGPVTQANGTYVARIWFFRDVTERKQYEDKLQAEEQRLVDVIESSATAGIAIIRADGTLAFVNQRFSHILGYDVATEVIGHPIMEFIPADRRVRVRLAMKALLSGERQTLQMESQVLTRQGATLDVLAEANTSVLQGEPVLIAVVLDISERKLAELALQRLNRTLRMVSAGNALLVRAEGESELVQGMCDVATRVGGYAACWIGFPDEHLPDQLRIIASSGADSALLDRLALRTTDTDRGRGPSGTAFRTGLVQVTQDIATDPRMRPWRAEASRRGYRSGASFPLKQAGDVIGVMTFSAGETNAFSAEELELLKELTDDLAFGVRALRDRVAGEKATGHLRQAMRATVQALANVAELRDPYTAGHQRNVGNLAAAIARELGMSDDEVDGIELAGMVHDIGKIQVPAELLSKPGTLSSLEHQLLQTHAQAGYDIVKNVAFPWPIAQMTLQHHERLDGSGYPQGLKGAAIRRDSMIIAVADVVEAMTAHRPYRPALGLEVALAEIEQGKGRLYDPEVVDACVRLFREKRFAFA